MFYTNAYPTNAQQAGGDINTSIHDFIIRKGTWTQDTNASQPTRSHKALRNVTNRLSNLAAKLTG